MRDLCITQDIRLFHQILRDIGKNLQIAFRPEMLDRCLQQMEVVVQRLLLQFGRFCRIGREPLRRSAEFDVDAVDVFDQVHYLVRRDVIVQPAAEFRCKIEFPIRKSACAAKAVHDAAGFAIDTPFRLPRDDRADPLLDRISLLDHCNLEIRAQIV